MLGLTMPLHLASGGNRCFQLHYAVINRDWQAGPPDFSIARFMILDPGRQACAFVFAGPEKRAGGCHNPG
jgi:hypothetical protein